MKSFTFNTYHLSDLFKELQEKLEGHSKKRYKDHLFTLHPNLGWGHFRGIGIKGGISYLEFDGEFNEDLEITIKTRHKTPICFTYCTEGILTHSFSSDARRKRNLCNFQTAIVTSLSHEEHILYFRKNIPIKTTLIVVHDNEILKSNNNKTTYQKLSDLLFEGKSIKNKVLIGSHNLKIAEKIAQLKSIKDEGVIKNLMIEGLIHTILAMEIQQWQNDLEQKENQIGSLTIREMEALRKVSNFVNKHSDEGLSLELLCKRSGLSPNKLQEGFKHMHKRTVTDYIRQVRLRKAEELIRTTDLNISEVVYSIGFTSRSYFSKIFKDKYNCSPKQYRNDKNYQLKRLG